MVWLVLGVLIWSVAHLLPSAGRGVRAALRGRLGEPAYKGLFSLVILLSVTLMVVGWRATIPVAVYPGPSWGGLAANAGMFVALILMTASALPTNLRRVVRHPQLTGAAVWAGAHLLANGEERSLVLFGGIGLWALLAIAFTNRRDGAWQKPPPQPATADLVLVVAAVVAFVVLFLLHPFFTGLPATPR